jgi:cell wall assembly regulator SMI1
MHRSSKRHLDTSAPSSQRRRLLMQSGLVALLPAAGLAEAVTGLLPHHELEVWLKVHLPRVVAALQPPASEARLNRLESLIGVALPEDYRSLYRWHNGQTEKVFAGPWPGLRFMPLDLVEKQWKFWYHLLDRETPEGRASYDEMAVSVRPGTIKEKYVNARWIPFAECGSSDYLGIDLDPGPNGSYGQVINFGRDQDLKRVVAPNIAAFTEWVLVLLRSGNFYIEDIDDGDVDFGLANPRTNDFLWALQTLLKQPGDLDHRSKLHCPA